MNFNILKEGRRLYSDHINSIERTPTDLRVVEETTKLWNEWFAKYNKELKFKDLNYIFN